MSDELPGRVAVYLDFENLVISLYDATHGDHQWRRDDPRRAATDEQRAKLEAARLDVDAVVDYAASLGIVTICRAYCDWTVPAFAAYGAALTRRSVDLVQMFPMSGTKNGADIRLAVDALEDLERFPYLTHLLVAAGDSDYVPLAQKARRLDRRVIGVGVAGSVGRYWELACDEFRQYDTLATLARDDEDDDEPVEQAPPPPARKKQAAKKTVAAEPVDDTPTQGAARGSTGDPARTARKLLVRALTLAHEQRSDDWVPLSMVKTLMLRLAPDFSERSLGYTTFTAFIEDHRSIAMLDAEDNRTRLQSLGKPGKR